jgi:hypothetical protein
MICFQPNGWTWDLRTVPMGPGKSLGNWLLIQMLNFQGVAEDQCPIITLENGRQRGASSTC